VARRARKGDERGLIQALSYRDVVRDRNGGLVDLGIRIRQEAAEALGRTATEDVVAPLVEALFRDASPHVRVAAARALAATGWPSAIDPLAQVVAEFADESLAWIRAEFVEALVAIDDPAAASALAHHLLYRLVPPELSDADRDALHAMPGWNIGDVDGVLVPPLIEALGDERSQVVDRAAEMLSWLPAAALEPLLDALGDHAARAGATLALGTLRDARAVRALVDVLEDREPEVRRRAAWSLGELRDPIAVEALIRTTRDADYAVRAEAGAALDKLGSVAVVLGVAAFMRPMLASAGMVEAAPEQRSLPKPTEEVPDWLRPVLHKLIAGEQQAGGDNGNHT
jgi:hypothetical protein